MLIQVPQRGCCGVCSGRRHPQRKSSIFVVVFLDSAYRSVSTRGHGRRCESNRFEKVRTIENHTDLRRDSPGETLIRSLHCNNSFKSYRVVASQSSVLFAVLTRNTHTHTHTHVTNYCCYCCHCYYTIASFSAVTTCHTAYITCIVETSSR